MQCWVQTSAQISANGCVEGKDDGGELACGLLTTCTPIDAVNGGAVQELEQLECLAFSIAVQTSFSEACALHFPLWPGRWVNVVQPGVGQ